MSEITRPMALDETLQDVAATLRVIAAKQGGYTKVYGFEINGSESDPSDMVTYIADAVGMTPAHMDYTNDKFDYGSWEDVWFVKDCKPCILGQDGVVQAYLDKDDYTKDVYGNAVTIDDTLVGANVMIEFPKIWYKVVPSADAKSAKVYIAPIKLDGEYKDYPYIASDKTHKEHFYMPAYNGSLVNDGTNDVLRSVSGKAVMYNKSGTQEIQYAQYNGSGWYTEDAGEIMLINFLLILLGKSTDTQTVFGQGITSGSDTAFYAYRTGAGNDKGLFWGDDDTTHCVKVFGIENWWGLQWRRYAGDVLVSGVQKSKLCYGQEDGSTTDNFNTDGSGYVNVGITPSGTSGGYISEMYFTTNGMYSKVSSGSATIFYTDGQWFNASDTRYAIRGGVSYCDSLCGALAVNRDLGVAVAHWARGASLSYK